MTTNLPGGAIRVSMPLNGEQQLQPQDAADSFGINSTNSASAPAHRTSGGQQTQQGYTRVQLGSVGNGEAGILSTLQAPGSGIAKPLHDAKPTDRVTINGIETEVRIAVAAGLLKVGPDGRLYEPNATERAQDAQARKQAVDDLPSERPDDTVEAAHEPLIPESEEVLNHLVEHTGNVDRMSALAEIIKDGEVSQKTLEAAASTLHAEPAQLQEAVQHLQASFTAQAEHSIRKQFGNIDMADLWQYANNDPTARKMLATAAQDHVTLRHTKSYAPLAREYLEGWAERNPQAALSAAKPEGVSVRQYNGQVLISIPGKPETTWRNAVRQGWIGSVSKA